ncbi:MAG: anti-sigma factor family protein [Anaerolineae bacterium]
MEHETAYSLMMDALDGELAESRQRELEAHLQACPPCGREWQALVAIDALFRQTPALAPVADFAQRTLARLPNRRYRRWAMSVLYLMLLGVGVAPAVLGYLAVDALRPVLSEPNILSSLLGTLGHFAEVLGTVLRALLSGAGEYVLQQPAVFGVLLVMAGLVSVWGGVYRQLLIPQRQTA